MLFIQFNFEVESIHPIDPSHLQATISTITKHWCPIKTYLEMCFETTKSITEKKWHAVQASTNMFWSHWLKEYLPILIQRQKSNYPSKNLNVDGLVNIQTDNISRSHWPLDCITETYPRVDGAVRTVKMKIPSNKRLSLAQKLIREGKQTLITCKSIVQKLSHWGGRMLRQAFMLYLLRLNFASLSGWTALCFCQSLSCFTIDSQKPFVVPIYSQIKSRNYQNLVKM